MTGEDRARWQALVKECEERCLNLAGSGRLAQEDQIETALMFLHLADWILSGMIDSLEDVENDVS